MSKEIWRDIPNYEGKYQISKFGSVRSLDRTIQTRNGVARRRKGCLLRLSLDTNGYHKVTLVNELGKKSFQIHRLMALTFLNHTRKKGYVIDHINGNKLDNSIENLQIITHRQNCTKDKIPKSGYTGVHYIEEKGKYMAVIWITRQETIGLFDTAEEASKAYNDKLKEVIDGK